MGMKLSGSLNLTGSLNVSGSNVQIGNNTLVGNTVLSGSVSISGSTVQIGNNTLIGNTVMSGSLTISGSQPGAATNINIYGDTSINGAIKFLPIVEAIDTSVSASYIFVSGSTQDLYFSQNGSGFNNITRLRWLEGNLYTGLLGGGVVSQIDSTNYKISSGSGMIVNLNATTASIEPYPIIKYITWGNLSSSIAAYSASYDQTFIGIDTNGNITKQGTPFANGQFDTLINIGLVLHQNNSTINAVKTQPNVSYGLSQRIGVFTRAFGPLKIDGFILSGSGTQGIQLSSGTGYLEGAAYSYDSNNPNYIVDLGTATSKIFRYYNTSSYTDNVYDTNGGTGYTVLDPTQYSNNGTLTTVSGTNATNSQWTIQRVFWYPNSVAKAFVVYYGNAQYTSQTLAIDGLQTETFVEAANTKANGIYLGAVLVRKDFVWTDSTTYKLVPAGLFRSVSAGGGGTSVFDSSLHSNYATTGSNVFIGNQTITGSLTVSGSITINSGSITMPNRPAFRVVGNASTDRVAPTILSSSYASIDYNEGNYYNNTTGLFTAPIAGLYQVYYNGRCGSVNAQQQVIIIKNGSITQFMWEAPGNTGVSHFGVSGIVKLAANDTLQASVVIGSIQFDGNDSWGAAYIG
jgi:hypothetical protein